jgi:hypothetical protein
MHGNLRGGRQGPPTVPQEVDVDCYANRNPCSAPRVHGIKKAY